MLLCVPPNSFTFKHLYKRVETRGRQGMRNKHVSTFCSPHSAVALPTAFLCCAQDQTLSILLGHKLYSNKEEWQSEDSIILTIQIPWKLPSFSFPWQEIIPVVFVMLNSSTPLALFSCVGLALKNRTWHLVSSQLKRYQFLDLMSAVPRSKARNIKVDIYYLFHGLHQWCFSLSFFVIIADVLPIMLRSLLKSVCPLQTNIHINVIHQQLTNASSLQHFLHDQKPHCFCRIWVFTECRIGPRGGISEFRSWTLSPSAQQCPGLAGAGSGRHCIRCLRCELLQRRHERQALRGAKALNRLFFFFFLIQ